jgi:uncharacterized protein (DUF433 family)
MCKSRPDLDSIEIADRYRAGATTVELAEMYRCTPAAINRRLRNAGVALREAKRRTRYDADPAFVQSVAVSYREGRSTADIAKDLGIGRSSVMRILNKAGVSTRRTGTRSKSITIPEDPLKLGYLAGLFDGEGNLQFKTNSHANGRPSTSCKIAIYGTVPATMGWLKAHIGGSVRWDYKRQERNGWLPCGSWEIYRAQDVLAFLRAVEPMLLAKRKEAIKAIKFLTQKCHADSPPTITQ